MVQLAGHSTKGKLIDKLKTRKTFDDECYYIDFPLTDVFYFRPMRYRDGLVGVIKYGDVFEVHQVTWHRSTKMVLVVIITIAFFLPRN